MEEVLNGAELDKYHAGTITVEASDLWIELVVAHVCIRGTHHVIEV